MAQPVTLENPDLKVTVYPSFGGKVSSIIDKADGHELLFDYPAELPTRPLYDVGYSDGWYAGWDECLPGIAPGPYPGHPYDGIRIPDPGELRGLPTTPVPAGDNGITTVWHGLRFGYRLTRRLTLDGSALSMRYTLVNLSPFVFRFVWAMHSLMSLKAGAQIQHTGDRRFRFSHTARDGEDIQRQFEWPMVEPGIDLSSPTALPAGRGWKVFAQQPIDRAIVVSYPSRNRQVAISYTSDDALTAYWGIWVNSGGWAGHHHFAVEPTTGRFDQLDRAVGDGSAASVGPLGKREWTVRWDIS